MNQTHPMDPFSDDLKLRAPDTQSLECQANVLGSKSLGKTKTSLTLLETQTVRMRLGDIQKEHRLVTRFGAGVGVALFC